MGYRHHSFDRVRLQIASGIEDSWIATMWQYCVNRTDNRICRWQSPGESGPEVYVKVYRRRPSHGLLKRWRPGRAIKEGNGYLEFSKRGIQTVPLIAWGEERHWGLWQRGVVVTEAIDAITVEEEYTSDENVELLCDTAELLARIHTVGLTHGDPLARNFLATRPDPVPFDLPSWGKLTPSSQREDLIRFLGSMLQLTENREITQDLLCRYTDRIDNLPQTEEDLLQESQNYVLRKKQA